MKHKDYLELRYNILPRIFRRKLCISNLAVEYGRILGFRYYIPETGMFYFIEESSDKKYYLEEGIIRSAERKLEVVKFSLDELLKSNSRSWIRVYFSTYVSLCYVVENNPRPANIGGYDITRPVYHNLELRSGLFNKQTDWPKYDKYTGRYYVLKDLNELSACMSAWGKHPLPPRKRESLFVLDLLNFLVWLSHLETFKRP